MEGVDTVAPIVSAVIKNGNTLVGQYQSLKNAKTEIEDRIIQVKCHWLRTSMQLDLVMRTWTNLHEDHRHHQFQLLTLLNGKLESAYHKLQRLLKKRKSSANNSNESQKVKRWKYLFVKTYIDQTLHDLARWQRLFDPSWYLIMAIASPAIDIELRRQDPARSLEAAQVMKSANKVRSARNPIPEDEKNIFLPMEGVADGQVTRIACSTAVLLRRPQSSAPYIIDSVPCPTGSYVGFTTQDIRRLASRLRCVDPLTFGILKCRGAIKMYANGGSKLTSFEIVFETPSPGEPRSLRSCLISRTTHALSDRVRLAKQLAASVSYVHTLGFVHKNVRPENLLGFGSSGAPGLGTFFLVGFEQVRSADGKTYLRGDDAWEKNIYRHPERQGPFPEEAYNMQHDIYSLGVCLLEIGMWDSFAMYSDEGTVETPGPALELSLEDIRRKRPSSIKDHLVMLARRELPRAVGDIYSEVVVHCLTCLDDDDDAEEEDYEDEKQADPDGVLVGVKYIEQVLLKLSEISV